MAIPSPAKGAMFQKVDSKTGWLTHIFQLDVCQNFGGEIGYVPIPGTVVNVIRNYNPAARATVDMYRLDTVPYFRMAECAPLGPDSPYRSLYTNIKLV